MTGTLLTVQIVLTVILTIVILLQKSSNMGFGTYSGGNDSVFGSKGPASFLSKLTFFLGFLFVVNTIALGYYYNQENKASVVDKLESIVPVAPTQGTSPVAPSAPQTEVPAASIAPTVPAAPEASTVPAAPQTNQ
jgi:preprotein translocase subunit SecG